MKRNNLILLIALCCLLATALQPARAQDPITEVIKAGVTKVIVAVDLQVQRLQNETIWLQNAQKVLENKLTELRLSEIADWSEQQRALYAGYFEELWQVKAVLAQYQQVRDIVQTQAALVEEYKRAYRLFRQDPNLTPEELDFLLQVYSGLLHESLTHLDQLLLAVSGNTTQMRDGARLELIQQAAAGIAQTYQHLRAFNADTIRLSLQRARERHNLQQIQALYNLNSGR